MSEINESDVQITSWRIAASTVHLCDRCQAFYASARLCDTCLHEANANPGEKRGILLPYAYDAADALSAIA